MCLCVGVRVPGLVCVHQCRLQDFLGRGVKPKRGEAPIYYFTKFS